MNLGSTGLGSTAGTGSIPVTPVPEIADAFAADALDVNTEEIDVVGLMCGPHGGTAAICRGAGVFTFWSYWVGGSRGSKGAGSNSVAQSMEDVVRHARRLDGGDVRFRGQFHGRDGSGEAACAPRDGWVVRDGPFAIWVTGRKPRGKGWALDAASPGDAGRWIEVAGRLELRGECVVLHAREVALAPRQ